jgi:glycosyltransferase involved in cell wall biosynthesis
MLKISHINFAKGFRGGERQTLLLIESLAAKGYKQTLLTRVDSLLAKKAASIKNVTIIAIRKPYFFSLFKIKESDMLHAHEAKAAHFAYFSHLRYGTPYLVTRRIDQPIRSSFLNQQVYAKAKRVVALSTKIKEKIYTLNNIINISVIPDAISNLPVDVKASSMIEKRFKGKFLIGNIGELDNKDKGQSYIIEVAKKLEKNHPKIHFLFLGKGVDEARYKAQAKGLNNITFEGYVDNVGDYIANFDLFVFPSLREGLGSILLDMMAFSIPIIATRVGGIPDIIEHDKNGLLVKTSDSIALEREIMRLYEDRVLRDRLVREAKKAALQYSADKMATRYLNLYQEHC